jgi:hypothetical protein
MTDKNKASKMPAYQLYTYRQRPDLVEAAGALIPTVWPEFMLHDPVADRFWDRLSEDFSDFQFVLCNGEDAIVAVGNSIPVVWDGTPEGLPYSGWDAVLEGGFSNLEQGCSPTALSALSASVAVQTQGQGVSYQVIEGMHFIAAQHGLASLVAPVRPRLKSIYPLIAIERYVAWMRPDGLPFDPWLRVHARLGAEILRIAPDSMTITGTVADWQKWTGIQLPESGVYVIPGALEPVIIDCESDTGRYVEPNVWMHHRVR